MYMHTQWKNSTLMNSGTFYKMEACWNCSQNDRYCILQLIYEKTGKSESYRQNIIVVSRN